MAAHPSDRCSIRRSSGARARRRASQAGAARHMVRNPVMFVVLVGSVLTTRRPGPRHRAGAWRRRLHAADRALALVHGALRQLRRGDGRGARQGAGRDAAQGADGRRRRSGSTTRANARRSRPVSATELRAGRPRPAAAGRHHPRRRRGDRGRRLGGRVGDHRRVAPRSSASRAATARRSPAAPRCCRTSSSSGSPPTRARRSSTG